MADMKWHKDKLPHNYIDHSREAEVIEEVKNAENRLNTAVKHLKERNIKIDDVEDVQNLTKEGVKAFINTACEKFLNSLGFCPDDVKLDTRTRYYNAYKELCPTIEEINGIVATYPTQIEKGENGFYFNEEGVKAYALEKATIHITKAIRDGFEIYRKLFNAIEEASKWEVENGKPQIAKRGGIVGFTNGVPQKVTIWEYFVKGGELADFTPEKYLVVMGVLPNKDLQKYLESF